MSSRSCLSGGDEEKLRRNNGDNMIQHFCITCGDPCTNKQCRSCFVSGKQTAKFVRRKKQKNFLIVKTI